MRVSAVQFKARREDLDASRAALVALADRAAARAHLCVLPEMAVTGYVHPSADHVRAVAEPPEGATFEALAPIAARHGTWLVCGFPELSGDSLYNSAMIVDPGGGLAGIYRKTLLYEADLPWATPGDTGYQRFECEAGAFGVGICMDLNDDSFTEWVRSADLRAVAFPTNWIDEDHDVWPYWAWRMADSGAALVAANTWGSEDGTRFRGLSAVVDGYTIRAAAPASGDGIIGCTLPATDWPGAPEGR